MANKITVKFEAQGAKALKTAIDQLHLSQVKLEKGTKAYKRALSKLNSETQKTSKTHQDFIEVDDLDSPGGTLQ